MSTTHLQVESPDKVQDSSPQPNHLHNTYVKKYPFTTTLPGHTAQHQTSSPLHKNEAPPQPPPQLDLALPCMTGPIDSIASPPVPSWT